MPRPSGPRAAGRGDAPACWYWLSGSRRWRGWRWRCSDPGEMVLPSTPRLLYLAVPLTLAHDPTMASARRQFVLRLHLIGFAAVLLLGTVVAGLLWRGAGPDATGRVLRDTLI